MHTLTLTGWRGKSFDGTQPGSPLSGRLWWLSLVLNKEKKSSVQLNRTETGWSSCHMICLPPEVNSTCFLQSYFNSQAQPSLMKQLTKLSSSDHRNRTKEQQRDTQLTPNDKELLKLHIIINETSDRSEIQEHLKTAQWPIMFLVQRSHTMKKNIFFDLKKKKKKKNY